jgi:hypothetical protein
MERTGVNYPLSVGVTGHRELGDIEAWVWVRAELYGFLAGLKRPLLGVTSLAIGADQIFAEIVLSLGGQIEAIIPFADYERTFRNEAELGKYEELKSLCVHVETLAPFPTEEEAFLSAGKTVVDRSDLLVAVWDGEPAHGRGGTGDIVDYALTRQKQLVNINPIAQKVVIGR